MAVILDGVVFVFHCSVCEKKLRGRWGVKTVPSDEAVQTCAEWIMREITKRHVCELK